MGSFDFFIKTFLDKRKYEDLSLVSLDFALSSELSLNVDFDTDLDYFSSFIDINFKDTSFDRVVFNDVYLNISAFPNHFDIRDFFVFVKKRDVLDFKDVNFPKKMLPLFAVDFENYFSDFRFSGSDAYLKEYVEDIWFSNLEIIADLYSSGVVSVVKKKVVSEVYNVLKISDDVYSKAFSRNFLGFESEIFDDLIYRGAGWNFISNFTKEFVDSISLDIDFLKSSGNFVLARDLNYVRNDFVEMYVSACKVDFFLQKYLT
ncbi:hypothetical protein K9L97_05265 [Candidatus Woesearchaeota archaeon]|nr:hypothetical protein [Candidatus Woesearchaeota archaeon]